MAMKQPQDIAANLERVIRGKSAVIEQLLVALLGGGHVLIEDVPGVGKTTLAKALTRSIQSKFHRIQFTPDLLPADIVGGSIYSPATGEFYFRPGPIFCNILLADEINRASPRTQSALLEAMSERQVTIEGHTHLLAEPFMVIATQNPIECQGTYPLPEAHLDRFAMQLELGYPSAAEELDILVDQKERHPLEAVQPVVDTAAMVELQAQVRRVGVEPTVARYITEVVRATRVDSRIKLGASPRASLLLYRMCQSRAILRGREFVTPDDVKALALPVLAHRLVLDTKAKYAGVKARVVVQDVLSSVSAPV